jgi:hypothetical protein
MDKDKYLKEIKRTFGGISKIEPKMCFDTCATKYSAMKGCHRCGHAL